MPNITKNQFRIQTTNAFPGYKMKIVKHCDKLENWNVKIDRSRKLAYSLQENFMIKLKIIKLDD